MSGDFRICRAYEALATSGRGSDDLANHGGTLHLYRSAPQHRLYSLFRKCAVQADHETRPWSIGQPLDPHQGDDLLKHCVMQRVPCLLK
jgi:hypothetical protein